jgi:hypothetical protein
MNQSAAAICAGFNVGAQAQRLLEDDMSAGKFVEALIEKKRFSDAIDFLAHALPAREGIWWGCLCMRHALGDKLAPPDRDAATAAVHWVIDSNEETRAAARASAAACGSMSIAGALAMAAGEPSAPAQSIARAVKIAAIKDPANISRVQRCYVELAMQIAEGQLL